MQTYDIQISSASDVERINAQGDYIYYLSGSAGGSSDCIEVRGINTGFRVHLKPGQGMRLPMGKVERDWLIKPSLSIAGSLYGAVVIGEGEIFDNRVTGSVEVIDGGKNRTNADISHMGYVSCANDGVIAHLQLWNPVNSGKNLIVEQLLNVAPAASIPQFGFNKAQISTNSGAGKSKKDGGNTSVAQLRSQASATVLENGIICLMQPNSVLRMTEPLIVSPGNGLIIRQNTSGYDLACSFEWYEEAI